MIEEELRKAAESWRKEFIKNNGDELDVLKEAAVGKNAFLVGAIAGVALSEEKMHDALKELFQCILRLHGDGQTQIANCDMFYFSSL